MSPSRKYFLLFLLLCVSCTEKRSTSDRLRPLPWIRWSVSTLPTRFPLGECNDSACSSVRSVLSEGLTRVEWDEGTLTVHPRTAVQWKAVPGGWEIQLNPAQRWSDGVTLDAQHFLDAWETKLSQCQRIKEVSQLYFIHNAKAFCEKKVPFAQVGAKRLSANVLFLQTNVSAAVLPFRLAHPTVLPLRKRFEGEFPPSLGPFQIESSGPASLKLTRNPFYLPEPVALGGIEFQLIPSPGTRVQAFFDGEIDFVDEIPPAFSSQLSASDSFLSIPTPRTLVVGLNNLPANVTKAQRIALIRAYDSLEMQKIVRPAVASTPAFPFEANFFEPLAFNPAGARKLWGEPVRTEAIRVFVARQLDREIHEVTENLRAQWLKNLNLKSEMVTSAFQAIELREQTWDIYEPSGGMDSALKLQFSETLVYPLYRRARYVLRGKSLDGLLPLPDGGWDFSKASIQVSE